MNSLPKTMYIRQEGETLIVETSAEAHAQDGETRIVGVYQLREKVEVATQTKVEVVTRKIRKPTSRTAPAETPALEPIDATSREQRDPDPVTA